eukprot:3296497-Pyramimonas_sp.AAC.1
MPAGNIPSETASFALPPASLLRAAHPHPALAALLPEGAPSALCASAPSAGHPASCRATTP